MAAYAKFYSLLDGENICGRIEVSSHAGKRFDNRDDSKDKWGAEFVAGRLATLMSYEIFSDIVFNEIPVNDDFIVEDIPCGLKLAVSYTFEDGMDTLCVKTFHPTLRVGAGQKIVSVRKFAGELAVSMCVWRNGRV